MLSQGISRMLFFVLLISYIEIILEAMISRFFTTKMYRVVFQLVEAFFSECYCYITRVDGKNYL